MNIQFPKTPYVECIFSLKTNNHAENCGTYDEYDITPATKKVGMKTYVYKLPEHLQGSVKPGDFVLVHCATGYRPCEVVAVDVITSYPEESIQPVVCTLDISTYIAYVDHHKKLKMMEARIKSEKKRLEAMVTYDLIAEKHPEFKEMLQAFRDMGGQL